MPTDSDTAPAWTGAGQAAHRGTTPPSPAPKPKPKPGPPPKPSVTSKSNPSNAGGYDLSKFTAGAIAEAEQEASDFAGWLGWPKSFNWSAMVKGVLQLGVQKDPTAAYQFLWTRLSAGERKANPNAYFGLTTQQYTEKLNSLKDMYQLYTGDTNVPDPLRNQALKENWTQSEMLSHLQADPKVGETAPWLAGGQTFRDVASQFASQYGTPQTGKDQLASWWKFRSGAQSVGASQPAQIQAQAPQRPLASDVETR